MIHAKYLFMFRIKVVVLYIVIFSYLSCKDKTISEDSDTLELSTEGTTNYYLIRHAEKDRSNPEDKDPQLSQEGMARAIKWASVFAKISLNKIYSTHYNRTMETAAPTAVSKGVTVEPYEAFTTDIDAFKSSNLNNNVLVVGHSNSIPAFANKLIGEDFYKQIDDHINSYLYVVTITNGQTSHMLLNVDHCISEDIEVSLH